MTAGTLLRAARKENGYTAKAMARVLGISPQFLNDIERDRRHLPVHRIAEFALIYAVDVADLFALVVPITLGYRLVQDGTAALGAGNVTALPERRTA